MVMQCQPLVSAVICKSFPVSDDVVEALKKWTLKNKGGKGRSPVAAALLKFAVTVVGAWSLSPAIYIYIYIYISVYLGI